MSDLPERLRAWATGDQNTSPDKLLREAATEIERLELGNVDRARLPISTRRLVERAERAEADLAQETVWCRKAELRAQDAEAKIERLRKALRLIKTFCDTHLPFANAKSEVVARRCSQAATHALESDNGEA